jgi:hypothetical protein
LYYHYYNNKDQLVSPPTSILRTSADYCYLIAGITPNDALLVLPDISPPFSVTAGQQFKVWYSEDFANWSPANNEGSACYDVFAIFY